MPGEDELEFDGRRLGLLMLLGLASGFHDLAQLARMLAVKSFSQRFLEGGLLGIIHRHADPGDRLEDGPLPTHRQDERAGHQPLEQLSLHRNTDEARRTSIQDKVHLGGGTFRNRGLEAELACLVLLRQQRTSF